VPLVIVSALVCLDQPPGATPGWIDVEGWRSDNGLRLK